MSDNALTVLGAAPSMLATLPDDSGDLSAGIGASFGVLTYRGKTWRVKYAGEEQAIMHPTEPGVAMSYMDLVVVKSSPAISKIYYKQGYVEGSSSPPDCFSVDGVRPDAGAASPQFEKCAACPQNQWGSRTTEAGKRGKACQDNKRLAVVPAGDLRNERFGGAFMLRVPPASLQDLGKYNTALQRAGGRYYGVVTRFSFDINEAYPSFVYTPLRWLTNEEVAVVLELQNSDVVHRILSAPVEGVTAEAEPAPLNIPGKPAAAAAAPAPAAQPAPQAAAQPAPQPAPQPVGVNPNPYVQPVAPQPTPTVTVMAGAQPITHPGRVVAGQAIDDLAIPEHLRRPLPGAGAAQVVQPTAVSFATAPAAQPTPPVQPMSAPVVQPAAQPTTGVGGGETAEQMRARIRQEIEAEMANKKPKSRVRAPSPTNADTTASAPTGGGIVLGAVAPAADPQAQMVAPASGATPQPEVPPQAQPQPGPVGDAMADLEAKLRNLVPNT